MKSLVNKHDTAKLLRGVDLFQYYEDGSLTEIDFSLEAMAINDEMDRRRKEIWDKAF